MRRYSVPLLFAALALALVVLYTYVRRASRDRQHPPRPIIRIEPGVQASAKTWHYSKDDPQTNCPIVQAVASSFRAVHDPATFDLQDVQLQLFNKGCTKYTYVKTSKAEFDEWSGSMASKGDVLIIMEVPADKKPDDQAATRKLVHVRTSGVHYDTKSGTASTDQPASFEFANGKGQSVGAAYDPNSRQLHMKSQVSLDWVGNGPPENAMHIEAGQLRYEEAQEKIYLSPWSRLRRNNVVINAANSEVTLDQGVLQQVVSENAAGLDEDKSRHVEYGAKQMTALFNDQGDMTQITAEPDAHLVSNDGMTATQVTAKRAVLKFAIQAENVGGAERHSSILNQALAQGNAIIESGPVSPENAKAADTRILRSDSMELAMKEGGKEIDSIKTLGRGQLEFKPNQPNRAHRWMDGDEIFIRYAGANTLDSLHAANVQTRTERAAAAGRNQKSTGKNAAAPPSLTWSDELKAHFEPQSNELASLEQSGHFRYEEGARRASAQRAFLEQAANRITLKDSAKVWDDTGTTSGDVIVLDQQTGDMEATGRVASTRKPDQQKDGGDNKPSLLDQTQPLQARADEMKTHDHNLQIHYEGHAILWQGANRIEADSVDINRGEQTLHAVGEVVSQLVDHQAEQKSETPASNNEGPGGGALRLQPVANHAGAAGVDQAVPKNKRQRTIYTEVRAPELLYHDQERLAHYTGGVTLTRERLTVTSKELRAFLTDDKNAGSSDASEGKDNGTSLDHAFADGDVKIVETSNGRTRTGASEHCEYYPKENKLILNGGLARMLDTRKGTSVGQQLTYYFDTDHVIVEGSPKLPVVSEMKKGK